MSAYLKTLTDALQGLPLPVPVTRFLKGEPTPLSLDTRETLPIWCSAHGYDDGQQKALGKLIRVIATRDRYFQAVAAGGNRIGLDGEDAGPVEASHREYAIEQLASVVVARKKAAAAKAATGPVGTPAPPAASQTSVTPPVMGRPLTMPAKPAERLTLPAASEQAPSPRSPPPAPIRPAAAPRRDTAIPSRLPKLPAARAPRPPTSSLLPTFAVREVVERVNNRRNSTRLIIAYNKAGNHAAAESERANWVVDTTQILVGEGYVRGVAMLQVAAMIDDMMTGLVSKVRR